MAKRRFQKGTFITDRHGSMYSKYYIDAPDGTTKQKMQFIGNIATMSERAARRQHALIMEDVNRQRGSIAPAVKGQTFADAVAKWRQAIAPNLSPATVRPRESFLRAHIMPRFATANLQEMGVDAIQTFATDLRKVPLSGKTIVNVLGTVFTIVDYAEKCGMRVAKVGFTDLQLGSTTREEPIVFFTREQAMDIIAAAREPFKTLFAVAWYTGCRAGEILALTVSDLDFDNKTIRVNKASDDRTREIRQPKTKASVAMLPLPSALEGVLRDYMMKSWKPNPGGILFATRKGSRPRSRANVVRIGLRPVLRKLGLPMAGMHAFRHGLATELAEAAVPLPVLQNQMRHADVKTTLKIYAHVIPQSQRDAMERVGSQSVERTNIVAIRAAK